MTARPVRCSGNAVKSALVVLLLALLGAGCGATDDRSGQTTPPLPTISSLPDDAYAIGWDGVGEPRIVRAAALPSGYEVEVVTVGLETPVGLAFLPDGRILVGEQHTGRIRLIADGVLHETPFSTIEGVVQGFLELGLIGLAVDPAFEENRWVYAFYVEADAEGLPGRAVILRLTERGGLGQEPVEIIELPATTTDKHNGGGLRFGPDGKLYVTIGDTDQQHLAADPASLPGTILRLNRDGTAPEDNPLRGQDNADPRVFAYGFRNLVGLAFHPDLPGSLIAADNGITDSDEIDIVRPGGFYGWPTRVGFADDEAIEDPVWLYLNSVGPAGMEVYTGERLAEFSGDLFFCQFHRGGALHRLRFADDFQRVQFDEVVATGCTAFVAQGPDELLYFVDRSGGRLLRIVGP